MTAIATARLTEFGPPSPARGTVPSAANQLFLKNTIVCRDDSGNAVVPVDGQGFRALGVSQHTYDNRTGSEAGGDAGDLDVELQFGVFGFDIEDGSDDPLPGQLVYVVDNQTVSVDNSGGAGLRGACGFVSEVRQVNGVDQAFVMIAPHIAGIAQALADLEYSA